MISIAMTTFNGEKYLKEQIDSILNQTYKDFELIICDDCSTDNTQNILKEYEKKDNRIHLYFNSNNLGFKKNFEKAISFCKGEYIAFSDQDDVWEDWKLQESIDAIGNKMLLSTDSLLVDENLKSLNRTFKGNLGIKKVCLDQEFLLKSLIHHSFIQGTTILANSNFIKKYLPIPDDCIYHDLYFAICAALNNSITYLDKPSVRYRQHSDNIIGNRKNNYFTFLKPVGYNKEKVFSKSRERICLINLELKHCKDEKMIKYLYDSKKYYEDLPYKRFYTIKFLYKYFYYINWENSNIKKILIISKKILGMILFKLTKR